ncbi:MAG: hypothetical protein ACFB14_05740 [Leptolyngbyaceae cyanobacterium]
MSILLWIFLAILVLLGATIAIGNRLFDDSLAREGLCPVCGGEGGPCDHCNGFGIIVDASKTQSALPQPEESSIKTHKSIR